jgi:sRNA-binding protein
MNKSDADEYIRLLAERYPACFVEVGKNRRPLKKNIIDDLRQREPHWDEYAMQQVLGLYMSHWGYLYAMTPGAWRVDLDGKQVEKITQQEADEAEKTRLESQAEHYAKRGQSPMVHQRRDDLSKITLNARAEDAAQLALTLLQQAKAGFGNALVDAASRLRTSYFADGMATFYGDLGKDIEGCLATMETLGKKLQPEQGGDNG